MRKHSLFIIFKVAVLFCSFLFVPWSGLTAAAETAQNRLLSLEDCLALARRFNPTLGGAVEKIRELTADYRAVRSQLFPQLASLAYYARLEPNRLPPGGSPAPLRVDLNGEEGFVGIAARQLLFNGGRTYYDTKAARIGAQAQGQEAVRTGDEVAFDVTRAFYRLVEAKENLKVAREALERGQEFLCLTKTFFKTGKVTRLDFFRAESQVCEARQAKTVAQNTVMLAREILAKTIGLKQKGEVDIRGGLPCLFPSAPDVDVLWREALEHNPEIRKLNLQIQQSEALVEAAKGALYPTLEVQSDIGTRHQDTAGTKGEWLAGVFMEFPLFEGGLRRAQIEAADSRQFQAIDRKHDRLNSLKIALTTARRDLENAKEGVTGTRQTVATNKEAYASAGALYRNGEAIGLDVLQTQVDLTASLFSLIRYKAEYEIARARIRQILGSPLPGANTDGGQNK